MKMARILPTTTFTNSFWLQIVLLHMSRANGKQFLRWEQSVDTIGKLLSIVGGIAKSPADGMEDSRCPWG